MKRSLANDEGVALPMLVLALVALILAAAFVVDVGGVYSARRQDQTAADVAALGAAQEIGDEGLVVSTAKSLAEATLDFDFTDDAWNSLDCVAPAGFVAATGARCVAIDATAERVWVKIPERAYPTTLGRVVRADGFDHSAFAVAGPEPAGLTGVLPFGLFGPAGNIECVKPGAANVPDPACEGEGDPTEGNFGTLNFGFYGNSQAGTEESCGGGGSDRMANNVAVGVDHALSLWASGDADRLDTGATGGSGPAGDACPDYGDLDPNGAWTSSGLDAGITGEGLYSGSQLLPGNQGSRFSDGGLPRLQRSLSSEPSWMQTSGVHRTRSITGRALDNIALHEFIGQGTDTATPISDIPESCQRSQFTDVTNLSAVATDEVRDYLLTFSSEGDRYAALWDRCFTHWAGDPWPGYLGQPITTATGLYSEPVTCSSSPCSGVIFGRNSEVTEPDLFDIQYEPRFAYVPELWEVETTGTTDVTFKAFRPIYIQRLYSGCSPTGCDVEFDPGITFAGTNPTNTSLSDADGVTAFLVPGGSLPGHLGDPGAPFDLNVTRFITLLR